MADRTSRTEDRTDGADRVELDLDVPYVSPEVLAAQNGKTVDMSKDVVEDEVPSDEEE